MVTRRRLNVTLYRVIKKTVHLVITVQKTCTNILNSLSHLQSGRGVVLTTYLLLVPRLRMGRAIPLPPLQGHEACNRVNFTLPITYNDNVVRIRDNRWR
jgi:hypothetical protein